MRFVAGKDIQVGILSERAACDTFRFRGRQWLALCAVLSAIGCGLLIHSQTISFYWDEGFHLLAAQLINRGKWPYLDFFFPQPPVNAYWNAAWMRLFGDNWRVVHAVAAVATSVAVMLASDFVYRTFQFPAWRLAAGVTTALCFGLNTLVVNFSTTGQAYALCLLLIVCAFRLSVEASGRTNPMWAAAAGIASGVAVASSLLTVPVAPVLLVWLLRYDRTSGRLRKSIAFLVGAVIPYLPVALLGFYGPRQVVFNLLEYHLLYRQVGWSGALSHDAEIISSWIDSGHALLLGLLAISGLVFAISRDCSPSRRREYYLCAWIVAAQALWFSTVIHPTFNQYFVFLVPFLAILAPAGLRMLALRFDSSEGRLWPTMIVATFLAIGVDKSLLEQRDNLNWRDAEAIAAKVNDVTPPTSSLFADEFIYFLTKRLPPVGLAHADAQKLSLPESLASRLRVVPGEELENGVSGGQFATVETCETDFSERLGLKPLYKQMQQFKECAVYWDLDLSRFTPAADRGS
jgi:hypothetical protein